ncbi:MAG: hypothetical protein V1758_10175 [Pseudomonadota bacterium]
MFRYEVAEALRIEGHDVMRASEIGQSRADDQEILQKVKIGARPWQLTIQPRRRGHVECKRKIRNGMAS